MDYVSNILDIKGEKRYNMTAITIILSLAYVYWTMRIRYTAKDNSVYIKDNFNLRYIKEEEI